MATTENYITQAAGDARYQALGSLGSATPAQVDAGDVGTAGVSTSAARQDHEHPVGITSAQLVPAATIAAWASWTPTFVNFTQGNGTVVAKFVQLGKTVHYRLAVTLGSTSAMGTNPTFSLPVTAASYASTEPRGIAALRDEGTADYQATVRNDSTTTNALFSLGASSVHTTISATAPFTWTTSDKFFAQGTYEAA